VTCRPRLILLLALTCALLASGLGWATTSDAAAQDASPGLIGQAIRAGLFDAQTALLAGDAEAAATAVDEAIVAAGRLALLFDADPETGAALQRSLAAAREAVTKQDAVALGVAHGRIWAALMRGAYAETLAAVKAGDPDGAASWLLLRDFRPTTRFARPNADATLAMQAFRAGKAGAVETIAAIETDLLDTYQARLETTLSDIGDADARTLSTSAAEAIGLADGYWAILAPTFAQQMGNAARADADITFAALVAAARSGDAAAFARAKTDAAAIVQSFRAAPLSEAEQARRAGQLLRYLSLIPVEYGRGVHQGQVILELEIVEARAFLDGAKTAFADLRLALRERNAAETATTEQALAHLDAALAAAAAQTEIAEPATIAADSEDTARRLTALFPPAWLEKSGDSDFDIVSSLLDQMVAAVAAGEYHQAESARIEAYAIFETGPEKRLLAFTPSEAQRVERLFWEGDGQTRGLHDLLANQAGVAELTASRQALDSALTDAQAALAAGTAPAAVIFNAATIVFREGLEAVLILASLLASMIGANRQYKRPLAIGALTALLATAALFVLARGALLSLGRYSEQVEAIVSIVAIGVLLLVMNWFFHKVYWTRWIAKHHDRRRRLLIGGAAGGAFGFMLLGFSSVFREGAETVLFLQALVLDAGTGIVVQGTLLGLAGTAVVGALTLVLQTKLPHKKMLIVTGVMIAAVLVTMVGSTVHTLQLVGWAPIAAIPGAERLPYWLGVWFGIYGTWQGLLAQIAAFVFVIGSYVLAERQHERSRHMHAVATPAVAGRNEVMPVV
jgi:high-affinity iron transporter